MKKLTLSLEPEVIEQAHDLARENGTSVSSMFERFIRGLAAGRQTGLRIGPLARKATGIISLPADRSDREVLEDALTEQYGLNE